jgi:hypothetical protein
MTIFADMAFDLGGRPLGGGLFSSPWATHYFVDGVNGNDGFDGTAPSRSKATIQSAVTAASRGDVIYVRPQAASVSTGFDRYVESVTVPLATSDLSIIGVTSSINPDFGPKMRYATTGYCINNYAHALHIENMGFLRGGTSTGCVNLENDGASNLKRGTDGTTIYNCTFKYGYGIYAASGGDGLTIERCRFSDCDYSIYITCSANPGRRFRIANNFFLANNGSAVANAYITYLAPLTDTLIVGNYFDQKPTAGYYIYSNAASNTGLIGNNFFAEADLDTDAELVPGGMIVTAAYDVGGFATT